MPGVVREGDVLNDPSPPATIHAVLQAIVRIEGVAVVVVGDPADDHGSGVHNAPVMVEGSAIARIEGIPIVRVGDAASCGHLAATGSALVTVE